MPSPWTVVEGLTEAERHDVDGLLEHVQRRAGDEALTESTRELLERGDPARHVLRREPDGSLDGYAVLADGDPIAVEPALGTYDDDLGCLLETLGRPVSLLLRTTRPDDEAALVERGWHESRALHRLSRPLPADPPPPTDLIVRAFEPGIDEAAWVAQNNAAFAGHPTQSNMTIERVVARESADWFDAKGFLLFFDGMSLVASCWTKVHHCEDGDVGEIYVISVAPTAQGRGLGRLAVLRGLEHLSAHGLAEAELFVEEDNRAAYALYLALGFTFDSRVVEYRLG